MWRVLPSKSQHFEPFWWIVGPAVIEPATVTLWVCCSAIWAKGQFTTATILRFLGNSLSALASLDHIKLRCFWIQTDLMTNCAKISIYSESSLCCWKLSFMIASRSIGSFTLIKSSNLRRECTTVEWFLFIFFPIWLRVSPALLNWWHITIRIAHTFAVLDGLVIISVVMLSYCIRIDICIPE